VVVRFFFFFFFFNDTATTEIYTLSLHDALPILCDWFRARGAEVSEQSPVHEDVSFKLPVELRRAERAAA